MYAYLLNYRSAEELAAERDDPTWDLECRPHVFAATVSPTEAWIGRRLSEIAEECGCPDDWHETTGGWVKDGPGAGTRYYRSWRLGPEGSDDEWARAMIVRVDLEERPRRKLPEVGALADAFGAVIRSWLSTQELEAVRRRNAGYAESHPDICATHDFCDANMAMHEAWVNLTGQDPLDYRDEVDGGGMDESATRVWGEAWSLAKALGFK